MSAHRLRTTFVLAAAAVSILAPPAARAAGMHDHGLPSPAESGPPPVVGENGAIRVPSVDLGVGQLEQRRTAQLGTAASIGVPHDFRFTDKLPETGITFVHQTTPDSTSDFKLVHYDHGNGLAVADVDGDHRPDLYFVSQLGSNELWRNLGAGRFENVTESSRTAIPGKVSVAASFADVDNDGDADLYVTTVREGNVLLRNDGKGRFTDVTAEAGVGYKGHSSGAVFFDYDRDGNLDLFVANVGVYTEPKKDPRGYYPGLLDAFHGHLHPERSEESVLYRNLGGGRFQDVTAASGLRNKAWSGDASPADVDGDGWLDLYVLNMQGDNHFWKNEKGKFSDRTAEYFPKTPWGAMGIEFFDQDGDGRLDLFLTDMHSDMSDEVGPGLETMKSVMQWPEEVLQGGANNIFGNAFYRNGGKPPFAEMSDALGLENYWPWGTSVGDVNADGWEDVFITASMSFPWRYALNSLLLNEKGAKFRAAELILGVEPRRDGRTHVPWVDLDCSSPKVKAHERLAPLCAGREGVVKMEGTLGSRSSAILDLDDDGDLDIVTSEFGAAPQVLVSDLAQRHPVRRLEVRLRGTRSNRQGLGALVRVRLADRVLTQQMDGKSGYLSQSDLPLYFGLGDGKAESVEVTWPSGLVQKVDGLPMSGSVEITEPPAAERKAG